MGNIILLRPKIDIEFSWPNPPIGLGYLASLLKKNGHQVDILDCSIINQSYKQVISKIKQLNPDIIGITALSSYYRGMKTLSRMLHPLHIPIILGGVHASVLPELCLRDCQADFVVIGEGEITLLELMNKWEDCEERKKVQGIAYLENNLFKVNPKRDLIQNLDEIPFPDWESINPLKYPPIPHGRYMKRYPVAPILTTRGCPYSCSYCASTQFWGRKFRRRSPQNVVDEIEYLVNNFGIREIHIWDDNFTLVKKHVIGICREILHRKLDLTLACPNGVRIDQLNKEILVLMRRVGFYSLVFAIESGVQSILDRANKKIDLKVIPKITKLAKGLGFHIPSYFIFGLPGETYATARKTIQFAKKLPLDTAAFFIAQPLPGSKLFEKWIQNQKSSDFTIDTFDFFVAKTKLELIDGKRKLTLPKDAYREFFFRPKQIFKFLKYNLEFFHKEQLYSLLQRVRHTF